MDLVHLTLNDLHYYHYGPSGPPHYLSSYLTFPVVSEHCIKSTDTMKRIIVLWSGSSIGGCPLEEASEQERIPSIIGSSVWCCPTSRVLVINSVISSIFLVDLLCIQYLWWLYLQISIWFLTSGIRALSRAGVVGNYFYFCRFFSEKKKEGREIPDIFSIFLWKICRKGL